MGIFLLLVTDEEIDGAMLKEKMEKHSATHPMSPQTTLNNANSALSSCHFEFSFCTFSSLWCVVWCIKITYSSKNILNPLNGVNAGYETDLKNTGRAERQW